MPDGDRPACAPGSVWMLSVRKGSPVRITRPVALASIAISAPSSSTHWPTVDATRRVPPLRPRPAASALPQAAPERCVARERDTLVKQACYARIDLERSPQYVTGETVREPLVA